MNFTEFSSTHVSYEEVVSSPTRGIWLTYFWPGTRPYHCHQWLTLRINVYLCSSTSKENSSTLCTQVAFISTVPLFVICPQIFCFNLRMKFHVKGSTYFHVILSCVQRDVWELMGKYHLYIKQEPSNLVLKDQWNVAIHLHEPKLVSDSWCPYTV
jgi:hypothetical protein